MFKNHYISEWSYQWSHSNGPKLWRCASFQMFPIAQKSEKYTFNECVVQRRTPSGHQPPHERVR